MNSKVKVLLGLLVVAVALGFGLFLIGLVFEPLDPFPRADKTAKCSNHSSVVLYQRKTRWFASETQWSVAQFDQNGKLVRRQALFTPPRWNDSEMHRTPDEFCDDK